MRFYTLGCLLVIISFSTLACSQQNKDYSNDVELNSLVDSASYSIGFQNGIRLSSLSFNDVNFDLYASGFLAGISEKENKIQDSELREMFVRFNEYIRDRIATENKLEEDQFFANNRIVEGVIETKSGLQYKIIKETEGQKPFAQNKVTVMYEGRLIDGTIFDTTYDDNEPSSFVLGQFIPGWIEGIQLMSIGSEYEFYIPADLAYGLNPRPGGAIQPGDALIFKIELLGIE